MEPGPSGDSPDSSPGPRPGRNPAPLGIPPGKNGQQPFLDKKTMLRLNSENSLISEEPVLGLDVGSVNVHAAFFGGGDEPGEMFFIPIKGDPVESILEALARISPAAGATKVRIVTTGIGRDLFSPVEGVERLNDISAASAAAHLLVPAAASIVEIGGHFSKWILLDGNGDIRDYALNELCAAGAGAFLEQQATRLHISIEELAGLAAAAPRGAPVAGRCSVFAKSDMIHLQQKGTPADEIAYGLCLALARNYAATVLKGRELEPPVAVTGGGGANPGLVRALREIFDIAAEDLLVHEHHRFFSAVGAAASASTTDEAVHRIDRLSARIAALSERGNARTADLERFGKVVSTGDGIEELPDPATLRGDVFLGVDVGSVSTDFALVDGDGATLAGVYLPTRGRPISVIEEGLAILDEKVGDRVRVRAAVTTGSGRYLAERFLAADAARNEITAQLSSTVHFFPEVDTIFEIGGQDSKFISVRNGSLQDFQMNKICAAGTGSFLEEQAERLKLSIIGEFADTALQSEFPADLGSRCTVFMDTELVHALQRGTPAEDVTAGLAYSIARNYLDRVVTNKPVGDHVVFQGGVASNRAVVAAFEQILNRGIKVHPVNRLSGAIGAALIARDLYDREPFETSFVGFKGGGDYTMKSFECRHCANLCQVNMIKRGDATAYFGDVCERYTGGADETDGAGKRPGLAEEREEILSRIMTRVKQSFAGEEPSAMDRLLGKYAPRALIAGLDAVRTPDDAIFGGADGDGPDKAAESAGVIGIPRASLYFELYPLWATMFRRLGYEVTVSEPSSRDMFAEGVRLLSTEACLPVKLAYSHVFDLSKSEADYIFFPSILDLPSPFGSPDLCSTCPYTQSLPFMVRSSVDAPMLLPQVNMAAEVDDLPEGLESLADDLGIEKRRLRAAYQTGKEVWLEFKEALRRRGDRLLAAEFEWAAVLIGKPYNIYDSYLNLNLSDHFTRMGVQAIPYEFIAPAAGGALDETWDSLPWRFNRDYVKVVQAVVGNPRLFPVIVSNFGCGPDGFTIKHLEKILDGKPSLFLEFDEHRGEAGLITRLEAFADEVKAFLEKEDDARVETPAGHAPAVQVSKRKFYVPYVSDHAYAFTGALRYAGHDAEVLPPPDEESLRKGEQHSSGKECHPYTILAGDLVTLTESLPAKEKGAVFFFPGTSIPCLLTQYGPGHRLILDRLGVDKIEILTPSSAEMYELLGVPGGYRLWRSLTAMDLMIKAVCRLRPYERVKGTVDAIHEDNCLDLERAAAEGDILEAAKRCVTRLESAPIDEAAFRRGRRPVIGIAGDIYTRANRFANRNLIEQLEDMGTEVWPSPFLVDIFDFGIRRDLKDSLNRRNLAEFFQKGSLYFLMELGEQRLLRLFREKFRYMEEPDFETITRLSAPYVGERSSEILMLNIAKMIDFAKNGAHGIINAMCFNCMIGSVSAAIISRLRRDHGNIPAINLVFGGTEGSSQMLKLEAFVQQVQSYARRKTG